MYRAIPAIGTLAVLLNAGPASAQLFSSWYDPCNCCRPVVCQPAYQTVPVTEYREIRQTVQRPVMETQYVDREVTEYHPVTEQRTAEIPTVEYVNVTENQTVTRDMGQWCTTYRCNPKMAPCQYDPRPGVAGWLNRSGYRIRSAFTPNVIAQRHYVPNVVAYNVPVTRQVAQHSTRKVAYNVTRMEPRTTTRKVAINTVRYVSQEIVQTQPVTVMRTVPIGSTFAYASPSGGSQSALAPQPDSIGGGSRSANSQNNDLGTGSKFTRDPQSSLNQKTTTDPIRRSSFPAQPPQQEAETPAPEPEQIVPTAAAPAPTKSVPSRPRVRLKKKKPSWANPPSTWPPRRSNKRRTLQDSSSAAPVSRRCPFLCAEKISRGRFERYLRGGAATRKRV
jgi:hypothetical protein